MKRFLLNISFVSALFLSFFPSSGLWGQIPIDQELTDSLRERGYRNISVVAVNPELVVWIENDVYRFEPDAISSALKIIFPYAKHFTHIVLIVQKQRVPVISIKIESKNITDYLGKAITEEEFSKRVNVSYELSKYKSLKKKTKTYNKNTLVTNLEIEPDIGLQLGNYDSPFRFKFGLMPTFKSSFYKGQLFTAKFYLPLVSHKYIDKFNYLRIELVDYSQTFNIHNSLFSKLSAGWFTQQRYGINMELIKYMFNGKLWLKGDISYTGYIAYLKNGVKGINFTSYPEPTIEIANVNYLQYYGEIAYRIPKYDLIMNVGYGKYLYHNFAWKVDLLRNFNEYIFGFVAYKSKTGYNYGFKLYVPLIPAKYKINKKFRIHSSKYLNYEYLAASDYVRTFSTATSISNDFWELNPQFIKRYLFNNLAK